MKIRDLKIWSNILPLLFTTFLAVPPAFAQPTEIQNRALTGNLMVYTGVDFIRTLIPNIITLLFVIAVVIALVYFILGAYRFITSAGNKDGAVKGREAMTAAIVGLVVLFLLYALLRLIGYFFNLPLLSLDIKPLLLR